MKSRKLLIAATALLGLGTGQVVSTAPNARNVSEQRQSNVAVKNGTGARELKEDHFGGYAGSILAGVMKDRGHTPYEWGTSAACARMVRKNRMHARGISHSRI